MRDHDLTLSCATDTCCCNHGGRCSCAHKKELGLDTVPESDSEGEALDLVTASRPTKLAARRRRANTVHSDGVPGVDAHGIHKTTTAKQRAAQKCSPYQLSRANSAHGSTGLGLTDGRMPAPMSGRSRAGSTIGQRRVKSEATSPMLSGASFTQINGNLPPLDLSSIDYPAYIPNRSSFDLFGATFSADPDGPMYSAGLSSSVDWSGYDFVDPNPESFAPSSYSQTGAASFNGMFNIDSGSEHMPHLANTTSTSGDVSEVEDFTSGPEADYDGMGNSNFLRQADLLNSFVPSTDIGSISYDNFAKGAEVSAMPSNGMSTVEEDPAFWIPNYNDGFPTGADEYNDTLGPNAMNSNWEI